MILSKRSVGKKSGARQEAHQFALEDECLEEVREPRNIESAPETHPRSPRHSVISIERWTQSASLLARRIPQAQQEITCEERPLAKRDRDFETPESVGAILARKDLAPVNRAFAERVRPVHERMLADLERPVSGRASAVPQARM